MPVAWLKRPDSWEYHRCPFASSIFWEYGVARMGPVQQGLKNNLFCCHPFQCSLFTLLFILERPYYSFANMGAFGLTSHQINDWNVSHRLQKRSLLIAVNCIAGLSIFFFGYDQGVMGGVNTAKGRLLNRTTGFKY